jgi:hypothetical protein
VGADVVITDGANSLTLLGITLTDLVRMILYSEYSQRAAICRPVCFCLLRLDIKQNPERCVPTKKRAVLLST